MVLRWTCVSLKVGKQSLFFSMMIKNVKKIHKNIKHNFFNVNSQIIFLFCYPRVAEFPDGIIDQGSFWI